MQETSRANLPLQGRCRRQKGCISLARKGGCTVFQRAKRVWLVFPRATARLYGFIVPPLTGGRWWRQPPKGGRISLGRSLVLKFFNTGGRAAHHNLLNLLNLFAPFEPSLRRRVIGDSPVVKVLSKLAPNYFQRAPTAILSEATQPFYTTLGTEARQARWMTYAPLRRRRRPLREYSPSRHFPIFPPIYSISHPYTLQTAQICRNSYFSPIFSNFLFFSLFSLLTYGSHGSYNTSRNKQGGFS